jgi:hypothetical protein
MLSKGANAGRKQGANNKSVGFNETDTNVSYLGFQMSPAHSFSHSNDIVQVESRGTVSIGFTSIFSRPCSCFAS